MHPNLRSIFHLTLDLKKYVISKLYLLKVTKAPETNFIITLVAIDHRVVVIQIQVGKNIIEDILLYGGFKVNINTKKLKKKLSNQPLTVKMSNSYESS
jgi:hypothetical protein